MGNRVSEGKCINCGTPLIQPNAWHCCTECVPILKAKVLKIKADPSEQRKMRTRIIGKVDP